MGFEALELALALHAAPGRIAELRARPLPAQGMAPLLRVALGQADALAEAAAVFPDDRHRLVDAARFFVEQQLLAREFDHDPWRVLGVNPGAPPELLRAHHHLLVRLVHPDRSDDWAGAYADRVNRAWRQLRHEEGRAEMLRAPAAPAAVGETWEARPAVPRVAPVQATMPPPRTSAPPLVWMAVGVALALTAAVAWQRLRPDTPTPVEAAAATATAPDDEPWYAEAAPLPATAGAAPLPELVPIAPLGAPPAVAANIAEPEPETTAPAATRPPPKASTNATSAPAPRRPPAPIRPAIVDAAATPPAEIAVAAAPEPEPVTTAEPAAATAADAPVSEPEPAALEPDGPTVLRSYRERYAAGDLGGLLGLYAREVHADTRHVAALAQDYARLFGNSQQRYIEFRDVRWQRHGDRLVGQARYETGYRKRSSLRKQLERGEVAIEVVLDGPASRLRRFERRAD